MASNGDEDVKEKKIEIQIERERYFLLQFVFISVPHLKLAFDLKALTVNCIHWIFQFRELYKYQLISTSSNFLAKNMSPTWALFLEFGFLCWFLPILDLYFSSLFGFAFVWLSTSSLHNFNLVQFCEIIKYAIVANYFQAETMETPYSIHFYQFILVEHCLHGEDKKWSCLENGHF